MLLAKEGEAEEATGICILHSLSFPFAYSRPLWSHVALGLAFGEGIFFLPFFLLFFGFFSVLFLQFSMGREQVSQNTVLKIPRQQMGRELERRRHQPARFTGVNIY